MSRKPGIAELLTVGHSTHPYADFVELLKRHHVELLADIRRFPGSLKYPQFNHTNLAEELPKAGIEYRWFESLGGRRKGKGAPSHNVGLRNESFRNYADYMATEAFHAAIEELLAEARARRVAYMCSEGLFWRCHRRLVSDYLVLHGHIVRHIMPNGSLQDHALTAGAERVGEDVIYRSEAEEAATPLFRAAAEDLHA